MMPSSPQQEVAPVVVASTVQDQRTASKTENKEGATSGGHTSSVITSLSGAQTVPEMNDDVATKTADGNEAFSSHEKVPTHLQTAKPLTPSSENDIISSVYDGTCPLGQLPALAKKCVRIFISSTFSGINATFILRGLSLCSDSLRNRSSHSSIYVRGHDRTPIVLLEAGRVLMGRV